MTGTGRVVVKIGAGVLIVGVLLIAFVTYQLWGTGLSMKSMRKRT